MADVTPANAAVLLGLESDRYTRMSEQDRAKSAKELYAVGTPGGPPSLKVIQDRLVQQMKGMGLALGDPLDLGGARSQLLERLPTDKRDAAAKLPLYVVMATVAAMGTGSTPQEVRKVMFTTADRTTAQGKDFTNAVFRDWAMQPPSQRQAFIDALVPTLNGWQANSLPRHAEFTRNLASAAARGIVPKAKGPS